MPIILTDVGAVQMLTKFFKNVPPAGGNNYTLKIFINDVTPLDSFTAASFTEAAGAGYAAKTLVAANFAITSPSGIPQAAYETQTFTFTGALGATVYGYYVVDGDGVLIHAERSLISYTPLLNGDIIVVTPVFQLSKGTPS